MTWYLKKSDDSIFGPVEISVLKSWATTGRVAPEDHISEDQENWIYAANLDELQMDWVLKFDDASEYGPLHVLAIKQMVQDGDLDPGLEAVHRSTGETRAVWEIALVVLFKTNRHLEESSGVLADRLSKVEAMAADAEERADRAGNAGERASEDEELAGRLSKAEARAAEAEVLAERLSKAEALTAEAEERLAQVEATGMKAEGSQVDTAPPQVAELPPDSAQAVRDWKDATEKLDIQKKETERWNARYDDLLQRTEKELAEFREQVDTLKRQAVQVTSENEQLTIRLSQSAKRLETLSSAGENPSGQLDALTESYNDLSNNYEVLMRQLSGKNDEIHGLMTSRADAESHADLAVQEMSTRLHREQEEADAARTRFRELEDTHLQLVKAYREMNDRYIQLRQNQGVVPEPNLKPAPVADDAAALPTKDKKSGWKPKVRLTR